MRLYSDVMNILDSLKQQVRVSIPEQASDSSVFELLPLWCAHVGGLERELPQQFRKSFF